MLTQLLVSSLTSYIPNERFLSAFYWQNAFIRVPGAIWVQFYKRVILNLHWIVLDSKVNSPESLFSVNESCHAAWWMQCWGRLMMERRRVLQINLLQGHNHQTWLKTTLGVRVSLIPTSPKGNTHFYRVQKDGCVGVCVILTVRRRPTLGNRKKKNSFSYAQKDY